MVARLLSSDDAAARLGIRRATLYDWLRQSDADQFVLRGQPVTIRYLQGGRAGQGRILLEQQEIDRLLSLMVAGPIASTPQRRSKPKPALRHITTHPGRPED